MSEMKPITDASWAQDVIAAKGLVLVDFWAPWCGPCQALMPTLVELADEYAAELTICKLNVDENPDIMGMLGVRSIPLLMLYRDGVEVVRMVGAVSKTTIATLIEKQL